MVGQGDAILIQSPSGQNVVYDGGPGRTRMVEHLEALEVTRVDLIVSSHNHADHIGGLAEVLRRYRPRLYLDNGVPATTLTYRRVLEAAGAAGSELLEPMARRISLGDVVLHVVPPPGIPGWDQNNNSVGLIVEYGSFRLSLEVMPNRVNGRGGPTSIPTHSSRSMCTRRVITDPVMVTARPGWPGSHPTSSSSVLDRITAMVTRRLRRLSCMPASGAERPQLHDPPRPDRSDMDDLLKVCEAGSIEVDAGGLGRSAAGDGGGRRGGGGLEPSPRST